MPNFNEVSRKEEVVIANIDRAIGGLQARQELAECEVEQQTSKVVIMIKIRINGEGQQLMAHTKVVELFIGEVPKGHLIYHKDGNKTNNRVENLGFITRKELMQIQATSTRMKPVVQLDEVTGKVLDEYKSLTAAAKTNFTDKATIRLALKENRPAIGFIWLTEEMALERGVYDVC